MSERKLLSKDISRVAVEIVCFKLEERGFKIRRKELKNAMAELENGIRVKIRASRLKNEGFYPRDILYYGWTVQKANREIDYDILVCVGFPNDEIIWKINDAIESEKTSELKELAKDIKIYIFKREEVEAIEDTNLPFKLVKKKLHIFPTIKELERASEERPHLICEKEKQINIEKEKYEEQWNALKRMRM
ncbi:MAG: hypothetical protein DRO23_09995 [Thermoprotei archaeon]|nr:MAG: hypothetical protein DRO23_09995 [Thermoprotei archaeon]